MTLTAPERTLATGERRFRVSRGLATVLAALVALVILSAIFAPTSISKGGLQGMLPFAAVLMIVALGQTFVVQQGGIDLSVPGSVSLVVVICTFIPNGDNSRLPMAVVLALVAALVAGVLNGFLVGERGINPIVATLGTNALLYAGVLGLSAGTPRITTTRLASIAGGTNFLMPNAMWFALVAVAIATVAMKLTVPGRRFEAVGANRVAARATGLRVKTHQTSAYVWAQVMYWMAGVLLAGIVREPSAFQGEAYLIPSVAAVVLGGTSLLGGRGYLVASAVAALFLQQLQNFVISLGYTYAVQTIITAAALAVGVALYTVNWSAVMRLFKRKSTPTPA
jgi:ribose transport system permease protein